MGLFPLNDTTFRKWRIELHACRGQGAHPEVPDLIVCPACNGSGKVTRPSSKEDLLVDEGTYPVSLGRLLILDSAEQGEKKAAPVFVTRWY